MLVIGTSCVPDHAWNEVILALQWIGWDHPDLRFLTCGAPHAHTETESARWQHVPSISAPESLAILQDRPICVVVYASGGPPWLHDLLAEGCAVIAVVACLDQTSADAEYKKDVTDKSPEWQSRLNSKNTEDLLQLAVPNGFTGPRSSIFPLTSSDECGRVFNFVGNVKKGVIQVPADGRMIAQAIDSLLIDPVRLSALTFHGSAYVGRLPRPRETAHALLREFRAACAPDVKLHNGGDVELVDDPLFDVA